MGNKTSKAEDEEKERRRVEKQWVGCGRWRRGDVRRRSEEFVLTEDEDEETEFLKVFCEEMCTPFVGDDDSSGHSHTSTSVSLAQSESKLMETEDDVEVWSNAATLCSSLSDDEEDEKIEEEVLMETNNVELLEEKKDNSEELFEEKIVLKKIEDLMDEVDQIEVIEGVECEMSGTESIAEEIVEEVEVISISSDSSFSPLASESENETEGDSSSVCDEEDDDELILRMSRINRLKELFPGVYDSVLVSLVDSGFPVALMEDEDTKGQQSLSQMSLDGVAEGEVEGDAFDPRVEDGKLLLPILKFQGGAFLYHVEECCSTDAKSSEVVNGT